MRLLLWHPESDCLFVVTNAADAAQALSNIETADVTGLPEYEFAYVIGLQTYIAWYGDGPWKFTQ